MPDRLISVIVIVIAASIVYAVILEVVVERYRWRTRPKVYCNQCESFEQPEMCIGRLCCSQCRSFSVVGFENERASRSYIRSRKAA